VVVATHDLPLGFRERSRERCRAADAHGKAEGPFDVCGAVQRPRRVRDPLRGNSSLATHVLELGQAKTSGRQRAGLVLVLSLDRPTEDRFDLAPVIPAL